MKDGLLAVHQWIATTNAEVERHTSGPPTCPLGWHEANRSVDAVGPDLDPVRAERRCGTCRLEHFDVVRPRRLVRDILLGYGRSAIGDAVDVVLWILAVFLVVSGIVVLVRGPSSRSHHVVRGIALILAGLLVGPGG